MSPASDSTRSTILDALGSGLPMLLLQFVLVLALLVAGIFIYMAITPFHERELLRNGNPAAATVLGGALECLSFATGLRSLGFVALGLYALAWVATRRRA